MGLGATRRRSGDLATGDSSPSQFPSHSASCIPRCAFSLGIPQPARSPCALDPTQALGSARAGPKVTVYGQDRGAAGKGPSGPSVQEGRSAVGPRAPKVAGVRVSDPTPGGALVPEGARCDSQSSGCSRLAGLGPRVLFAKFRRGRRRGGGRVYAGSPGSDR